MRATTHAAFGSAFVIATGTAMGVRLGPAVAAFTTLGALLPDIDTPTSLVGKTCLPVFRVLERRFGHRTVTHSLLGLVLASAPVLPFGLVSPDWPLAFVLGYLSHLLIDCVNKSGAPLFFPSPVRAVLPRNESVRIAVGSGAETVLLVLLLALLAVLVPLHSMGFTRALHALTQTTGGAIADYRMWEGRYEVWADVDGTFRLSQRHVHQRYRILGLASAGTLILEDPATGTVYAAGSGEMGNIHVRSIRAAPGRPIRVETRSVELRHQLLADLLRDVPAEGETYLVGTVKTADAPTLRPEPEQYGVVKPGAHGLELRFARPRDIDAAELAALFVVSGVVLVRTVLSAETATSAARSRPPPADEFDDVTQLSIAHLTDPARELLVREGQRVRRGDLIARLSYKDPELERRRAHAHAQLEERLAAVALQEGKLRQVQALLTVQLAAPAAVDQEEVALLRARVAVEQARRELAHVDEDARRLAEVRVPVDGRILTVRVQAIHGGESTALVRLLYRKPFSAECCRANSAWGDSVPAGVYDEQR